MLKKNALSAPRACEFPHRRGAQTADRIDVHSGGAVIVVRSLPVVREWRACGGGSCSGGGMGRHRFPIGRGEGGRWKRIGLRIVPSGPEADSWCLVFSLTSSMRTARVGRRSIYIASTRAAPHDR